MEYKYHIVNFILWKNIEQFNLFKISKTYFKSLKQFRRSLKSDD